MQISVRLSARCKPYLNLSGLSQVCPLRLSGLSQVRLGPLKLLAYFVSQSEPEILRLFSS